MGMLLNGFKQKLKNRKTLAQRCRFSTRPPNTVRVNLFMDGEMKEVRERTGDVGVTLWDTEGMLNGG